MTWYVINLSAWIVFIDLPARIIHRTVYVLAHVANMALRLSAWLMPNDPRDEVPHGEHHT